MAREWNIHSWRITASAGPIASELEKTVLPKVAPPPEQTFLANAVRIEHEPSGWVLSFNAEDALNQSVADKNEPVRVALANKWQADRVDVLQDVKKLNYDWTYTTSYAGRWIKKNHPEVAMTMTKSEKQLNVELLTDRAIPLVAYHEAPLFVSELDDAGASELTVRVRVTDRYWFVLLRFYLRVDDTVVRLRDVRWYWDDKATSVIRETRWHQTSDPSVVRASGSSSDQAASLMMSMAPTGVVHYAIEETDVPLGICSLDCSVSELKQSIRQQLFAPGDGQEILALSTNKELLTKDDIGFADMPDGATLSSLGLSNGSIVCMLTSGEREVEGVKLPAFMKAGRTTMTVEEMVAKQTRIERQESSSVASVSFDMHAANAFQAYVSSLGFHNKRGGVLYGEVKDDKVYVQAIYEPEQQGSTEDLEVDHTSPQAKRADAIAAAWGWKKVGQIFSISAKSERDYMFSAAEVMSMSAIQEELGELAFTVVVSQESPDSDDDDGPPPEVHFEAFQVSKQCVELCSKGWFSVGETPNEFKCVNPDDTKDKTPVIVGRTDVSQVDVDYFLVPVAIDSHSSEFLSSFPVENRLTGQTPADLKAQIRSGKSLAEALKDFHAVLYVTGQAGMSTDEAASLATSVLLGEVKDGSGYGLIALSVAGL